MNAKSSNDPNRYRLDEKISFIPTADKRAQPAGLIARIAPFT